MSEETGLPISVEDWEQRAREVLEDGPYDFLSSGAGAETTMRANYEAFERWRLWPRMLRDISQRDLTTTVLNTRLAAPFMLAPVGSQTVAHPDGELAAARAAAAEGVPFVLSTFSSVPMEEIAAAMGDSPRLFQMYVGTDRDVMSSFLHRAERAGYSAIVITVDNPVRGYRERDLRNAFLPFLAGAGLANYTTDPVFIDKLGQLPNDEPGLAVVRFLETHLDPSLTWDDVQAIRRQTRLPVLLKGIVHPDDAAKALDVGINGIIISNHGGRMLDGAVATLDVLPLICEAVRGQVPVLLDSGVRRGADVVKALSLGAAAVLIGRLYALALAVAGEAGVRQVIRDLKTQVDITMALVGARTVAEVNRSLVTRAG